MTLLEQMAEFSAGLDLAQVPPEVRDRTKLCLQDALECCFSGTNEDPRTKSAWTYVKGSTGDSTAFLKGKRISAEQAAFYNAVTGAVSSRNDVSKAGSCHAGAVVVPVAAALAEERKVSGKTVLEAVLCGYETMIRLGAALKAAKIPGAFRQTALLAPFGAAFAAAKVMGLGVRETVSAVSFACHSASGFNSWVSEGTGEDVLQNAWGARNGLAAARLAETGLPGGKGILEDRDGMLAAFGALPCKDMLTEGLGEKWHILDVSFKAMGSCLKLQAPCQAVRELLPEIGDPELVEEVEVRVAEATIHHPGTSDTEADSKVRAIMSIPFGVANVLADGDYRRIRWEAPYSDAVRHYMKLCTVRKDDYLTSVYPGKRGAGVKVLLSDGRILDRLLPDIEEQGAEEIRALFRESAEECLGTENGNRLLQVTDTLEEPGKAEELWKLLCGSKT